MKRFALSIALSESCRIPGCWRFTLENDLRGARGAGERDHNLGTCKPQRERSSKPFVPRNASVSKHERPG